MPVPPAPPSPPMNKEAMAADDDYTLYSDSSSMYSRSNASTSSFVSYTAYDELPPFRLPKADGNKEVYEAWTIYLSSDYDEKIKKQTILGIKVSELYDSFPGRISSFSELYDQDELKDMYLKSLSGYKSAHKRSWPSRLVRGARGTSYEDDIDARIRKLPEAVQSEITNLLGDREVSSSNRFHNRAWTVVTMQQQLHRRFADANPKPLPDRRHKVRFWKNPGKSDPVEYFLILRGSEGHAVRDRRQGQTEFKRFENPWHHADESEIRKKTREENSRRREKRGRKTIPPPSYRYSTPSPPPLPTFLPHRGMYTAPPPPQPGSYTRPHVGMPRYPPPPPPGPPAAPKVDQRTCPYGYPQPPAPAAPMPPVSYPPPIPPPELRPSAYNPAPLPHPGASAPSFPGSYPSMYCGMPRTSVAAFFSPPAPPAPPSAPPPVRPFGCFPPLRPTQCFPGALPKYYNPSPSPPQPGLNPFPAEGMEPCYTFDPLASSETSSIRSWVPDGGVTVAPRRKESPVQDKREEEDDDDESSQREEAARLMRVENYQRQLMELEAENKRRLMIARREQEEAALNVPDSEDEDEDEDEEDEDEEDEGTESEAGNEEEEKASDGGSECLGGNGVDD